MIKKTVGAAILAAAFALSCATASAQTNQGSSPMTPAKGGTNSRFVGFTGPASTVKTFTLPNANETLAALGQIQTWTGAQSFGDGKLILLGSSSGAGTLKAPAAASTYVWTLPAATGTLADIGSAQTLTAKTFDTASNTFLLNGVAFGTATQATAALNNMVGDSGSGGTKGLVPAPAGGDAAAGKYLKADGTYDIPPGGSGLAAASQAQMESASSTAVATTPGRQHNHPGHPKAWIRCTNSSGTYTIQSSYGVNTTTTNSVAGCGKTGTGRLTITFATAFSSTAFACVMAIDSFLSHFAFPASTTTVNIGIQTNAGVDTNEGFSVACFGDQ